MTSKSKFWNQYIQFWCLRHPALGNSLLFPMNLDGFLACGFACSLIFSKINLCFSSPDHILFPFLFQKTATSKTTPKCSLFLDLDKTSKSCSRLDGSSLFEVPATQKSHLFRTPFPCAPQVLPNLCLYNFLIEKDEPEGTPNHSKNQQKTRFKTNTQKKP